MRWAEGVLRECAVSFRLQHEAIRSEVGRVQSMLSDAIVTLTANAIILITHDAKVASFANRINYDARWKGFR